MVESNDEDDDELVAEEKELAKNLKGDSDDELLDVPEDPSHAVDIASLNVGDYVLVAVHGKKTVKRFVAITTSIIKDDEEVSVDFLASLGNHFVRPEKQDSATVHIDDVMLLLPPPSVTGGTKRTSQKLTFAVDLSTYL